MLIKEECSESGIILMHNEATRRALYRRCVHIGLHLLNKAVDWNQVSAASKDKPFFFSRKTYRTLFVHFSANNIEQCIWLLVYGGSQALGNTSGVRNKVIHNLLCNLILFDVVFVERKHLYVVFKGEVKCTGESRDWADYCSFLEGKGDWAGVCRFD